MSGELVIEAGGSKAFSMRLRPRAIGRLDITISAKTDQDQSDAVKKLLFVKVLVLLLLMGVEKLW